MNEQILSKPSTMESVKFFAFSKRFEKEIDWVSKMHAGQTRNDGVTPYMTHPLRVAFKLYEADYNDVVVLAALGHDLLEDTAATYGMVCSELGESSAQIIDILTKRPGISYKTYAESVAANSSAKLVKMFDANDNLNDSPSKKQIEKYSRLFMFFLTGKWV